ncbi:MAG: ROK family protein [Bacteroidales bacterium]|nr:ROK family protein [Bacteroidales bacterium]
MVYIGIDLGGTKVSGAIFQEDNSIIIQERMMLEGRGGTDVSDLISELCRRLLMLAAIPDNHKISIGICVPGIAYSRTGRVWAPNIPGWEDFPLRDELLKVFPTAGITAESDRTCYILGETSQGIARGCQNAIFIAVGTGIGAGILIDGQILHGNSDIVGATGWMALKPPYTNEYDKCGCFETYASGTGIALQARKLVLNNSSYKGMLSEIPADNITAHNVFRAYSENDAIALKVINDAVEMWGMAAANFVSLFNPEMVIFGGGIFGPATPLIEKIYAEAVKWAQPISIKQCTFAATTLPDTAGLYGAGRTAIISNLR